MLVYDLRLDALERLPDAALPTRVVRIGVGDRARLGQPVALVELDVPQLLEPVEDLEREARTPRVGKAQRLELVLGGVGWLIMSLNIAGTANMIVIPSSSSWSMTVGASHSGTG